MKLEILSCLLIVSLSTSLSAQTGVDRDDARIAGWATEVISLDRGPEDIAVPGSPDVSFGVAGNALGPADWVDGFSGVVSLGDGGSITLGFAQPIADIPGPDFAVFENGFTFDGGLFTELAFVEVSSNGVDFFRFDAISQSPTDTQIGPFNAIDPANLINLAGIHEASIGTPFDLAELVGSAPALDVSAVTQIRLVDVIGSITPGIGSPDTLGNLINDPYPTIGAGSGFDLDAIAVLQTVPEPTSGLLALCVLIGLAGQRDRS